MILYPLDVPGLLGDIVTVAVWAEAKTIKEKTRKKPKTRENIFAFNINYLPALIISITFAASIGPSANCTNCNFFVRVGSFTADSRTSTASGKATTLPAVLLQSSKSLLFPTFSVTWVDVDLGCAAKSPLTGTFWFAYDKPAKTLET